MPLPEEVLQRAGRRPRDSDQSHKDAIGASVAGAVVAVVGVAVGVVAWRRRRKKNEEGKRSTYQGRPRTFVLRRSGKGTLERREEILFSYLF